MTQSVRLRLIYWSLFVGMLLTVATTCGLVSICRFWQFDGGRTHVVCRRA